MGNIQVIVNILARLCHISGVCGSVPFAARCGTSFDLESFLDDAGILFVEGGRGDTNAKAVVMGALVLRVINYVRNRGRSTPRVLLVLLTPA